MQGFLAAGHVCTVMGMAQYEPLVERYHVPIVVTGFEPLDVLEGIRRCVVQLEEGRAEVENAYPRAVRPRATRPAQAVVAEVFETCDRAWRGIGVIPDSRAGGCARVRRLRRRAPLRRRAASRRRSRRCAGPARCCRA